MNKIKCIAAVVLSLVPVTLDNTTVFPIVNPQERYCIYEALWHEARGESKEGIRAVLSVIQNRTVSGKFPNSFCKVIRQKFQFSYILQKRKLNPEPRTKEELELSNWMLVQSEKVLLGQYKPLLPSDVLWYHSVKVKPKWSRKLKLVKIIGNHKFYSER